MTVGELIEILQDSPEDATVYIAHSFDDEPIEIDTVYITDDDDLILGIETVDD